MDPISKFVMDHFIDVTAELIMPIMVVTFFGGIFIRFILYFVATSEYRFTMEFSKRVRAYFTSQGNPKVDSFSRLCKILLLKTYYDLFDPNDKKKMRYKNLDDVTSINERLFMIQQGVRRLIEDTVKQVRYIKRNPSHPENADSQKMLNISKSVFSNNAFFNKVLGVFSASLMSDILNILPSLFIIGGIFGTFLGISRSLPDLGGMDLSNMDETKRIMDMFLLKISQAMIKSIIGIAFSVATSLVNTVFSIEGIAYTVVNRYTESLEYIWNETTTNEADNSDPFPVQTSPNITATKAA